MKLHINKALVLDGVDGSYTYIRTKYIMSVKIEDVYILGSDGNRYFEEEDKKLVTVVLKDGTSVVCKAYKNSVDHEKILRCLESEQ